MLSLVRNNDRRSKGRIATGVLYSNFGQVLDISAGGARLHSRRRRGVKVGDTLSLAIVGLEGEVHVKARVVRRERDGWFNLFLGVSFVNVSEASHAALVKLARSAMGESVLRNSA